ncbi:HmuY family protein [Marivirga sp. S37H4]|uniref:HmuY family protein n=1 Tax=Marivirga aurantiaca TaxID=2802615 RepID=A0A935C6G4_9BACT|nr:HmuY family protein [Marivirga aurantiaca]MBK6264431.1 HmuY family protein [Marivirga aurantiaca]
MNIKNTFFMLCCSFLSLFLFSCDDDEQVQALSVSFSASEIGFSGEESEKSIEIIFSRATDQSGILNLSIEAGNLTYGEQNDFYTMPAAENNTLQIPFESGVNQLSFHVHKGAGLNIEEDQSISFKLQSTSDDFFQIGVNNELTAQFSENFLSASGRLELNSGGADFPLQSFADLSKHSVRSVDKYSWDLGFTTDNTFRVILNSSAQVMARAIDKVDLTNVTAEDTVDFANEMQIGFMATNAAVAWIDSPNGDLSATAIAEISANDSENKVYIIKRLGDHRDWKKVKINRNGDGYSIQYADIDATEFSTTEIQKDAAYNFKFFDLDQGETEFEPAKDTWDIMYGTYTEIVSFGQPAIPYSYNDYIIINRNQTSVSLVMVEDFSFEEFSIEHTTEVSFESEINALGANWRQGGGPGSAPQLFDDRFFVIKDADENFYKIRFTRLYSEDGERGYPEFEYQLLD